MEKISQSKGANQQQTQPTYGFNNGNPGHIDGRHVLKGGQRCSKVLKGSTATVWEVLTIQLEQRRLE